MLDLVFAAALLSSSVALPTGPCRLATSSEVERALGGAAVDVPADEIGEETAPGCLWASARRAVEIKLSIWSVDELPVLGLTDAESYFAKLEADFAARGSVQPVDGFAARAFEADGAIVVLKAGRVIVFEFVSVSAREAREFALSVVSRL